MTTMSSHARTALMAFALGGLPGAFAAEDAATTRLLPAAAEYTPGQLIVSFQPGVALPTREQALAALGMHSLRTLRGATGRAAERGATHLVELPAGMPLAQAQRALREVAGILYAEPNWIITTQGSKVDPYYRSGRLWGLYGSASPLHRNAYGSHAADAFRAGARCSEDVIVGIGDSGVMIDHPDLAANIWTNPYEIPDNGLDDDGNGFIDDVHGWDFKNDDNTLFDGELDEHGTHVAGIIAALGGNGIGVVGVCPKARLIDTKFIQGTGTTFNAIEAIDYLTDLKRRHGLNIVAANHSWITPMFSSSLRAALADAGRAGILIVAAAGNNQSDAEVFPDYPAAYDLPNIVSVASITSSGSLSRFSNYGAISVDLAAPGSDIWSTVPVRRGTSWVGGYASFEGTSMAAPHVTGAAALYASMHPGATIEQIKAAILGGTTPTPSLNGKTVTGGRLNLTGF